MFRHFKGESLQRDYTGSVNPSASFHGLPSTGPSRARWISPSLILVLVPYAIKHGKRVLNDFRCLSINLVNMLSCGSQPVARDSRTRCGFMDNAGHLAHSKINNLFCFSHQQQMATTQASNQNPRFFHTNSSACHLKIKPNQAVDVNIHPTTVFVVTCGIKSGAASPFIRY